MRGGVPLHFQQRLGLQQSFGPFPAEAARAPPLREPAFLKGSCAQIVYSIYFDPKVPNIGSTFNLQRGNECR